MEYTFNINGSEKTVTLDKNKNSDTLSASIDDSTSDIEVIPASDNLLLLKVDGVTWPVRYMRSGDSIHMMIDGHNFVAVDPIDEYSVSIADTVEIIDGKQILVAPMPGQVVKVNVSVGDEVTKKQCLIILEAMKMENELCTDIDGTVLAIHAEAGQQVGALQPLVEVTQKQK